MAYTNELDDMLNRGYRYALSLTNKEDSAFDLVQNAYLKICEQNKPLVISYFIRTIRNLYIDKQRRKTVRLKWLNLNKNKPSTYEQSIGVEPVLEKLIDQLKPLEREILMLSVVEEYTAKEIAELLKMSRNTVLSIISRTKKKLKMALHEQ
jgi:RNA polymerase sigma factor (sigma-70 family)